MSFYMVIRNIAPILPVSFGVANIVDIFIPFSKSFAICNFLCCKSLHKVVLMHGHVSHVCECAQVMLRAMDCSITAKSIYNFFCYEMFDLSIYFLDSDRNYALE